MTDHCTEEGGRNAPTHPMHPPRSSPPSQRRITIHLFTLARSRVVPAKGLLEASYACAVEKPGKGDNPAQGMHASLTEAKIRPKGISPSPLILNGGGQKGVWMDGGRIQACKKIPPGNESNQGPRDPHSMCIVRMEQKRKEKYTHIRQREK